MKKKNKILLINPCVKGNKLKSLSFTVTLPMALLSLASTLTNRYEVIILDRAVKNDDKTLLEILEDSSLICVGISVLTGPPIADAIYCSQLIKKTKKNVKIVWGGWHVTKAPKSVIQEDFVDYIVRGEGEEAFPKLLYCIENDDLDKKIPGLGYKENNEIVINEMAQLLDVDELPELPYELIDNIEPYIRKDWPPGAKRAICMETSRGCPMGCAYCEIPSHFNKNYSAKSADKVVLTIKKLIKLFNIDGVLFQDPNFFLQIERVKEFSKQLISNNIDIKWSGDGTILQFKQIKEEDIKLFYCSGLRSFTTGIESGSEKVRFNLLNKKFTNLECKTVLNKLNSAGINVRFNMIIGLPGETIEDTKQSVDFVLNILSEYQNTLMGRYMFIYLPLPGTPLSNLAIKKGYIPPTKLVDFIEYDFIIRKKIKIPWLTMKQTKIIETISAMSAFLTSNGKDIPLPKIWRVPFKIARRVYLFRLKKHIFYKTPDIHILQRLLHYAP
ncbi:MAG: B12-binding domain-containing radical SAM protein [Candidatus Aureabacteria bacterium]|nr:B12-binding domain-containing radical SAM protein [Candidatus Auribacterota bacterium]